MSSVMDFLPSLQVQQGFPPIRQGQNPIMRDWLTHKVVQVQEYTYVA